MNDVTRKLIQLKFLCFIIPLFFLSGNVLWGDGCTCDSGCDSQVTISSGFSQNGNGEYCWVASCIGEYINSWNLAVLEINGVDFTNTWTNASSLPAKIDGVYYIYYRGSYGWSHFEIRGTCIEEPDNTDPPSTDPPTPTPAETQVSTSAPTGTPTSPPTATPTSAPTATPISVSTATPTSVPTATPVASTPTPAPAETDPPNQGGGCTCDSGCDSQTRISSGFTQNGSGEFCWVASCIGEYVNSWNLAVLEINGVDFTNTWTNASSLPAKIDGVYYIYYKGNYGWSHFEIKGECEEPMESTDPPSTNPPTTNPPTETTVPTPEPTSPPIGGGDHIWIEAESGAAYVPQILKSDSYADNSPNDSASQEIYFEVNGGSNSTGSAPQDGHMVYNFTISQSGDYRVWARVKTPNTSDDSFWVRMDSGSWTKWENIGPFSEWDWDIAGDYTLSSGSHTITFAYCEDGAKFDKILITGDFVYTPSGFGDPEPQPTGGNTYSRNDMVDVHGDLQVIGTNLCNKNGNPVQLRGLNTHGPQWYPIVENHTIPNLVQSWGIDIIRIAMYIEDFKNGDFWNGYMAHKEDIKQKVTGYVDDAIDAGIYVIIDWHIHNNPSNFTGDAKDFFAEMAQRYGSYPNVLFEICNEPEYTDWPIVKSYAEEVIPVIRSNDSDSNENIIIVGTPNWSQDVNTAADDPLKGFNNIMYALHFYAASHKQSYRDKAQYALDNGIAIIATEWSSCDYDVSYSDFGEADTWINWLNSYNISWINWSFCNRDDKSAILKPGVSMAGPWSSSDLTEAGTWIKQKIQQ